jgi:MraZ protein
MFRGGSFHSLDDKGRIIIPARFKAELESWASTDRFFLTVLDGGLMAYPVGEWVALEKRILDLKETSPAIWRFKRYFIGSAVECQLDRQGRVVIPQTLKEYAGLEKDIVLVGVLNHFEIWSRDKWEANSHKLDDDMLQEEVLKEIKSLGI